MFFRVLIFLLGTAALSTGIATVTNAHLGTGSISALAYVLTLITGVSMGAYVFLTNVIFFLVEIAVDPTAIWKKALAQIPTVFLFSAFIDIAMMLTASLTPDTLWGQLIMVLIGCTVIGFGISAMVHARLAILPPEGAVLAVMKRWGGSFGTLRMGVDVVIVTAGVIISFAFFGELRGIGIGTIIAALVSGNMAKLFLKGWAKLSPKHHAVD